MLKKIIIILLGLHCISAFGQTNGIERINIIGEITDEDLRPVSYAHIIEKSGNEGWVSDYYGNFRADVYPSDTLVISAISFHHSTVVIPSDLKSREFHVKIILKQDTVLLKELVIHPWPATYSQLKEEFLKVEVKDPSADLDLNLPSMKDLAILARTQGIPGQIGLYSGPGPLSILYDQFSKEARSRRLYAELINKDKASTRYNKVVVSTITGLKNENDIQKFMQYCALQIKFILESTEYELYAAILKCYNDYSNAGLAPDQIEE